MKKEEKKEYEEIIKPLLEEKEKLMKMFQETTQRNDMIKTRLVEIQGAIKQLNQMYNKEQG